MPYLNILDLPQISSSDACRAAGIDSATLKNWLSRKPPILSEVDRETRGGRSIFLLSLARVFELAIVAELVRGRIQPQQAAAWATRFTRFGGVASKGEARHPGHLFPRSHTYLVATPDSDQAKVIAVDPSDPIALLGAIGTHAHVLALNTVVLRVRGALDLPAAPAVKDLRPDEGAVWAGDDPDFMVRAIANMEAARVAAEGQETPASRQDA